MSREPLTGAKPVTTTTRGSHETTQRLRHAYNRVHMTTGPVGEQLCGQRPGPAMIRRTDQQAPWFHVGEQMNVAGSLAYILRRRLAGARVEYGS